MSPVSDTLRAKVEMLNKDFFIGEEGTSYGGYYDYCVKFLRMVDECQENRLPEIDMAGISDGIKIPQAGSLKSAGATLLPFYESPYYRGGLDWRNVIPGTAVPGIIFAQASKITNSNLAHSKYGGRASELELRVSATFARLVGYDPARAAGIFVDAGTKANLYGYMLGLRKAFPNLVQTGIMKLDREVRFVNSQAGHFSNMTNLALIGVGLDNAVRVPIAERSAVDLAKLEEILTDLRRRNVAVPTILLTVGTTDTFGADDVKAVAEIRDRVFAGCDVKPHIHADAAIGWAMIFFNDYDFAENPHGFDRETVEGLRRRQDLFRNLRYADSITMDFHKTGYTPYAASMVLIRNRDDLIPFKWKPGTFRYFNPEEIEIAPVQYTLECTRSPEAVFSITGNLLAFGIEGYQVCLGWAIQVSNHLRRRLAELPYVGIINPDEGGLSTVFRVYPRGADGKAELKRELTDPGYRAKLEENSRFSQELFRRRDKQLTVWDAKLDYTSAGTWAPYDHETPIPGWKAYILNPRVTIESVDRFIEGLGKHHAAFEPAAANEDGRGELSPPRPRATET